MGAKLDYPAAIQHHDPVRIPDRREAMCHDKARPVPCQTADRLLD